VVTGCVSSDNGERGVRASEPVTLQPKEFVFVKVGNAVYVYYWVVLPYLFDIVDQSLGEIRSDLAGCSV